MKKYILTAIVLLGVVSAKAVPFVEGGITFDSDPGVQGQCFVTFPAEGNYQGDVSIPSKISHEGVSYDVTAIGEYAFAGSESLSSVTIPESVVTIGRNAFQSCNAIKEISFPSRVTCIKEQTFYSCKSLKNFTGKGIDSIEKGAFSNCISLSSPVVGILIYVGDGAFKGCSSLKSFSFPKGTILGEGIFDGCTSMTSATLPSDLKVIPPYTFNSCKALTSVQNISGLTEIGDYAFSSCSSLSAFTFGKSLERIGRSAFAMCSSLHLSSVSGAELVIGDFAFTGCSSLVELDFKNVYDVGIEAFANVSGLQSITFDSKIRYIHERAFRGCEEISTVVCLADQPPFLENTSFPQTVYDNAILEVPNGKSLLYAQMPPWSYFKKIVDVGIEDITGQSPVFEVGLIHDGFTVVGENGILTVYSMSGARILECMKNEEKQSVPFPYSGVFVISLNGKAGKVIARR